MLFLKKHGLLDWDFLGPMAFIALLFISKGVI